MSEVTWKILVVNVLVVIPLVAVFSVLVWKWRQRERTPLAKALSRRSALTEQRMAFYISLGFDDTTAAQRALADVQADAEQTAAEVAKL